MHQVEIDEIATVLLSATRILALISTERAESFMRYQQHSMSHWKTFGAMLDPTAYRESLQSGHLDDLKHQFAIAEALLLLRKAIDAREAFCQTIRNSIEEQS